MIQRIQSVYLFIAGILLVLALCFPFGSFIAESGLPIGVFKALGVHSVADGSMSYTWGVFCILLLSAIIAFLTIFLFKNRMLQVRMCVFNSILLLGFYAVFLVFMFMMKKSSGAAGFHVGWALGLPVVAIILQYLAFRAIYRDILLVRACDRLR